MFLLNIEISIYYIIYCRDASHHDPDTSGEVQKARTAQALRAFLHLLPPGEDC